MSAATVEVTVRGAAALREVVWPQLEALPIRAHLTLRDGGESDSDELVVGSLDGAEDWQRRRLWKELDPEALACWVASRWLILRCRGAGDPVALCERWLRLFPRLFVVWFDGDTTMLYAEGVWPRRLGWPVDQFAGLRVLDLGTPEQVAPLKAPLAEALAGGVASIDDASFGVPYEMIAFPTADHRGMYIARLEQAVATAADLDELATLRLENQSLRGEVEELEQLLQRAAHDLRAPLRHVLVFSELLGGSASLKGEDLAHLQRIRGAGERTLSLLDDLMDYARSGVSIGLEHQVDLREVVGEAALDVGIGGRLKVHFLPTIAGSRTLLRLLFQNLLQNAIRYAEPDRELQVRVTSSRTQEAWEVRVSDNGTGIAPGDVERIFLPFVRARTEGEGSGVGLATCRRVMRRHGGQIRLEASDQGATFVLAFPFDGVLGS